MICNDEWKIIKIYNLEIFFHYLREHYQDGFALMPRIDISDEPDDAIIDLRDKLGELDRYVYHTKKCIVMNYYIHISSSVDLYSLSPLLLNSLYSL